MRSGVGILSGAMLALVLGCLPGPALALESYAAVKRALYQQVFAEQRETLYCGCPFDSDRRPDLRSCGYVSDRNGPRSRRIEIEHVMPASWIGRGRPCWHRNICRDAKGRPSKGRTCCLAIDPTFRDAYQDMHNLWPTVGEVNEKRRNYPFALIDGEERTFGRCDIEIDSTRRQVEPRPAIRGDIARINLYMAETHGIHLTADQRLLFTLWDRSDPPDAAEHRRNETIRSLQGRHNPYVMRHIQTPVF